MRNQPVSRVHAPREFDICTGSADADVAVLARRPPEQREEYAVDEVQQCKARDDLPQRGFHDRVEDVSVRQSIGHVLPHDADLAPRLTKRVEAVHEPVLFVLAAHHLLIFAARRSRHIRIKGRTAPCDLVEEAHRRRPYFFDGPRLRRRRAARPVRRQLALGALARPYDRPEPDVRVAHAGQVARLEVVSVARRRRWRLVALCLLRHDFVRCARLNAAVAVQQSQSPTF